MVVKKKGVSKKSSKKKVRKTPVSKADPKVTKKDFETFKFGVQRLKELEKELNLLDTRGFAKEERSIRSKLKKVSEIPSIEREIKQLRQKINNKYKPVRKKKSPTKEIKKGIDELNGEIDSLKSSGKSTKKDLEAIQLQLKKLQNKSSTQKDLEEIRSLLKKLQNKKPKVNFDPRVDVLVDTNFHEFLNDTKIALSQQIHEKEELLDETLKVDLEKREAQYHKKHDALLKDFRNKQKRLEKEIKSKFNELAKQKAEIDERLKREEAHLNDTLSKSKKTLDSNFKKRKRDLEDKYKKDYDKKCQTTLQKEVSDKFNQMLKKKIEAEKVRLGKEYTAQLKRHADYILEKQKKVLLDKFEKDKMNFEMHKDDVMKRMQQKASKEYQSKLNSEIAKKEQIIRQRLQNEFDLNLKRKIQEHETELKKKKLDLELEVQKKIKQMLA